jgi:hypothetical protein
MTSLPLSYEQPLRALSTADLCKPALWGGHSGLEDRSRPNLHHVWAAKLNRSNPVGVAQPYELWHYREIKEFGPAEHLPGTLNYKTTIVTRKDVDMKFVDVCRCGEFQLQPVQN